MSKTFWLSDYNGITKGGYYIRNDLFKFFKKLKNEGIKPVGIRVDDDWNLEIFVDANTVKESK